MATIDCPHCSERVDVPDHPSFSPRQRLLDAFALCPAPQEDEPGVYVVPADATRLRPDLWVCWHDEPPSPWAAFVFLASHSAEDVEGPYYATVLMVGEGILGNLRECRHTYWGDEGYLFYPSAGQIRAMLDYLEAQGFALTH
jgi:hypothetical protein